VRGAKDFVNYILDIKTGMATGVGGDVKISVTSFLVDPLLQGMLFSVLLLIYNPIALG